MFYYCNEINNTFLDKLEGTIGGKVDALLRALQGEVRRPEFAGEILAHILRDKFGHSADGDVRAAAAAGLGEELMSELVRHIVQSKFEQRRASGDVHGTRMLRIIRGRARFLGRRNCRNLP